jgi:hypothetical protein
MLLFENFGGQVFQRKIILVPSILDHGRTSASNMMREDLVLEIWDSLIKASSFIQLRT